MSRNRNRRRANNNNFVPQPSIQNNNNKLVTLNPEDALLIVFKGDKEGLAFSKHMTSPFKSLGIIQQEDVRELAKYMLYTIYLHNLSRFIDV